MKILHLLGQCSPALGVTALAQIRIHQLLIYGVWMEKRASHCRLSPYPITRNLSEQGRGPIPRSSYDELTLVYCCSFSRFFAFALIYFRLDDNKPLMLLAHIFILHSHIDFSLRILWHISGVMKPWHSIFWRTRLHLATAGISQTRISEFPANIHGKVGILFSSCIKKYMHTCVFIHFFFTCSYFFFVTSIIVSLGISFFILFSPVCRL